MSNAVYDPMTLPGAMLEVKCLSCTTTYEVGPCDVSMSEMINVDEGELDHYRVWFKDEGAEVYIQDMLCMPKRCRIRGIMPDGGVFAFPCLAHHTGKTGIPRWQSSPDSQGAHFAIRMPDGAVSIQ